MNNTQPLALASVLVLGIWLGHWGFDWMHSEVSNPLEDADRYAWSVKWPGWVDPAGTEAQLLEIVRLFDERYVDVVDKSELIDAAVTAMAEELDPHTVFISDEEMASMTENMEGNFEGIGVEFLIQNDTLMVVATIPGGPSEANGILAGDRILKVEGEAISGPGLTNRKVMTLLKGPRGTQVKVGLSRQGQEFEVELTRDRIPIQSVVASFVMDNQVGYIKAVRFASTTASEFRRALDGLRRQGANSVVVDLRGNGGGYLQEVVTMLELFLEKNTLMVYTEGKSSPEQRYTSSRTGPYADWPLAVLVDEQSASASEIFAGAIQDNDRGIVIGRRTFGKGLVQEEFDVAGSGALRLTVARFYTPSGREIQKPYDDYEDDFYQRLESGELYEANSMPLADSLKYFTVRGRVVYGGGGIVPDVFVPLDSSQSNQWVNQWVWSGVMRTAVFAWMDDHRDALESCRGSFDIESLPNWEVGVLQALKNQARKQSITWSQPTSEEEAKMRHRFLSQIVRMHWGESESYKVLVESDEGVLRATHALLEEDLFERLGSTVSLVNPTILNSNKQEDDGF